MLMEFLLALVNILIIGCIIILTLFLAYSVYIFWIRRCYSHLPVPPYQSFYIANGTELAQGDSTGTSHLVFIRWAEQCGPVFYFTVLHKVIIMLNTPELAKHILTNSKYGKAKSLYSKTQYAGGVRFLGNGLATNFDHDDWKRKRHAINPAFSRSTEERLVAVFNDAADRLVGDLEKDADTGDLVSMLNRLHRTTLDVTGQAGFSENILMIDENGFDFTKAIYLTLKSITLGFRNPIFEWLPWNFTFLNHVQKHALYLRRRAKQMLETRIKELSEGYESRSDILDVIVRSMVGHFPIEDLVDEVITLFVASQETTASIISFLLLELGRNESTQLKIRDEIDSTVGSKRIITPKDVSKLTWTAACLKETLRLYPPTGGTTRDSLDENELISTFLIPAKSVYMVNFFAIHYLTVKDGYNFRPDRFMTHECDMNYDPRLVPPQYSQLGFSMGQRACIGRHFAYLEAKIIIAKLFQHYTFQLDPEESFTVENAGTFRPANGAKMLLFRR